MAQRLDARAAAFAISGRMQQPSAQDRHIEAFVTQVLDVLHLEHSIANAAMVVHALRDMDIVPHEFKEYPKAVEIKTIDNHGNDVTKTVIVHDEDEELAVLHPEGKGQGEANEPEPLSESGDGNQEPAKPKDPNNDLVKPKPPAAPAKLPTRPNLK